MPETVFSSLLRKDIVLDGEDLKIYRHLCLSRFANPTDPSFCVGLEALGYTWERDFQHVSNRNAPLVKALTTLKIEPAMAAYARECLQDESDLVVGRKGTMESSPSLLALALQKASIEQISRFQQEGWDIKLACILAAFPEQQARLEQIISHGLVRYPAFINCKHDVGMLSRLHQKANVGTEGIVEFLDAGFTEQELYDFGFLIPRNYTLEEVRSITKSPAAIKSIFTAFKESSAKQDLTPAPFLPTVEQLEKLVALGLKNSTQYKQLIRARGKKITDPSAMYDVISILQVASFEEAKVLFKGTQEVDAYALAEAANLLQTGFTLRDYFKFRHAFGLENDVEYFLSKPEIYQALSNLYADN